jgi:hypothetical protein
MALSAMTEGVTRVVQLATEINDLIGIQRIHFIDIGACVIQRLHEEIYNSALLQQDLQVILYLALCQYTQSHSSCPP